MNKRSENMRRVNRIRSEVTAAMIDLLDELENGTGGDYTGFDEWNVKEAHKLKGQLNSYRAQAITQALGKTISKQKLLKYTKPRGYPYTLSNQDIRSWLKENQEALLKYSDFNIAVMTRGEVTTTN